jgi:serine/threonine-protein kinase
MTQPADQGPPADSLPGAFARLDACGADQEIVRLVKACLAPDPADPSSGAAAADSFAAYFTGVQDRLRAAEAGRAEAQARAEEANAKTTAERRKRRRMAVAVAAAALALSVGVGGGCFWVLKARQDQAERARAEAERAVAVAADLQQAEEHRRRGRLAEAAAALERADGRLAGAEGPELRRRVADQRAALDRVRDERDLVARLDEVRLAREAMTGARFDAGGADAGYRDAFARVGLDPERLDPAEAAERVRATTVAERVTAALDDWIAVKQDLKSPGWERLRAVTERVDDDPWRRRLRAALDAKDKSALQRLADEPQVAALQPADLVQLGDALERLGARPAALAVRWEARRRFPADFWLNHQLARQLLGEGRYEDAVRFYTVAAALRPDSPGARVNLGIALNATGRTEAAVEEFAKVLASDRDNVLARYNLAVTRQQQGRLDEAEQEYRVVFGLKPQMAEAHNNLGVLLKKRGRLDDAMAEYRAALAIDSDLPQAHCNIGIDLQEQGRLREGLEELRRGHELALRGTPWPMPTERWLRDGEALVRRDAVLPLLLRGEAAPADAAEAIAFADLCRRPFHRRYAAAVRFYADAFAADPTLADDLSAPRYEAARTAVLAALGKGADSPADGDARGRLRAQALAWLREELAAWTRRIDEGSAEDRDSCRQTLRSWTKDDDLDSVRHPVALVDLPGAEQEDWRRFWADVDAAVAKATPTKGP